MRSPACDQNKSGREERRERRKMLAVSILSSELEHLRQRYADLRYSYLHASKVEWLRQRLTIQIAIKEREIAELQD